LAARLRGEIDGARVRVQRAHWRTLRPSPTVSRSRFQKDRMSSEARYRIVKLSYKQLVTIRLLLLHTLTNLPMRTNELERANARSLLMPKRYDFFKSLEFPAIAGDSPIAKFTTHSLPVSTNYATANFCRLGLMCWPYSRD
jgi:hypothetical protein